MSKICITCGKEKTWKDVKPSDINPRKRLQDASIIA